MQSDRDVLVARTWWLRQQDDRFVLLPDRGEAPPGRWPALTLEGGVVCGLRSAAGWRQRWIEARAAPLTLPIAHATQLSAIAIDSGRRHYRLARLHRPQWAKELARDGHGLHLDVDLKGVVQRFRWIEPGEFLMGSPDDEAERGDDEGPRHRVRLTAGFWLADTACTQALWAAVMGGKNPSRFQDDARNPVETVSWDEVGAFLRRVAALLAGVVVELPTEAEWEYACRAGSDTPFNFGATITTEQANYLGSEPYAGGEKGESRQKTMPVKSFAPNRWGLYEMHGNVWEWCVDGTRPYDGNDQENPRGPDEGYYPDRAVRGGSWCFEARWLRSAARLVGPGRFESHTLVVGFRFALRSTSQEQVAGAEHLQQDLNPEGPEAPPGMAAFPGREGSVAASADAEAATGGSGKARLNMGWGDDALGLWIDVDLAGVVQRFRWIEPGEFRMGSPADEPERTEDEGPRHRVRLTTGFWLADTACTQALWMAVMGGENPSAFQEDARNPVEGVSWDDVSCASGFLQRVASLAPGVIAELPTEAEWEYACRAGSETPFHFGPTIGPEQANYDGKHPYAGGRKGEYGQKTVPVKSFVPNDWGLYEMHGNVWEWCADGPRNYTDGTVADPRGPDVDAPRVMRGGSWFSEGGWLRSASRNEGPRDDRGDNLGFRFALRSTSQEQEAGAERLPAASGVTRDA